jgi:hypothetical protein
MTLRKTDTVDWLGIEKGSKHVALMLLDEEDWSDEQRHLELLEAKLNSYLAFIESGEIYDRLAALGATGVEKTTPIKVNITAQYEVPPRARKFLAYAENMFKQAGFSLRHEVKPV